MTSLLSAPMAASGFVTHRGAENGYPLPAQVHTPGDVIRYLTPQTLQKQGQLTLRGATGTLTEPEPAAALLNEFELEPFP